MHEIEVGLTDIQERKHFQIICVNLLHKKTQFDILSRERLGWWIFYQEFHMIYIHLWIFTFDTNHKLFVIMYIKWVKRWIEVESYEFSERGGGRDTLSRSHACRINPANTKDLDSLFTSFRTWSRKSISFWKRFDSHTNMKALVHQ